MNEINWEYMCEDDSNGDGYSQVLLNLARKSGYTNGHSKLRPDVALDGWEKYLNETKRNTKNYVDKIANFFARVGFPSNAHSVINHANVVITERTNDDVGSLPPTIAFLRGAVEQYYNSEDKEKSKEKKTWGIDLSMWWGVISSCVNPYPASLHRRALWNTYFAGASFISIEACGYIDPVTKQPYPISEEIDSLGTFMKTKVSPMMRGVHDSPIAIIMSKNNGWNERPSWGRGGQGTTVWNYGNIPWYNQLGSGAIDGIFGMAYPGVDGTVGFRAFPYWE